MIVAVLYATFAVAKRKPEKLQTIFFFFFLGFLFATAKVAYIKMIILHLILHSAVHIYDFHIIQNFNPACAERFLREECKPKPHDDSNIRLCREGGESHISFMSSQKT